MYQTPYTNGLEGIVAEDAPINYRVFSHHVYEYRKGLRSLVLHTSALALRPTIEKRLEQEEISYLMYQISDQSVNTFFGDASFVEVIRKINKPQLTQYSPEEDFILGIMLGYGRAQQCERYLTTTARS